MRTLFDDMMKYGRRVLAIAAIGMILTACGGGGGSGGGDSTVPTVNADTPSDDSSDDTQKVSVTSGRFVFSVQGLNYTCSDGSIGVTGSVGQVDCVDGGTVKFDLMGYALGSTPMLNNMSPLDLTEDQDKALNIAQLLMTVDKDGDASNGIEVDSTVAQSLTFLEIPLDAEDFDEQLSAYLETEVVSEVKAVSYYNTFLSALGEPTFIVPRIDEDTDGSVPDDTSTNTYDDDGRLIKVSDDYDGDGVLDSITTYVYDADGRLLSFNIDEDADGSVDTISTYN